MNTWSCDVNIMHLILFMCHLMNQHRFIRCNHAYTSLQLLILREVYDFLLILIKTWRRSLPYPVICPSKPYFEEYSNVFAEFGLNMLLAGSSNTCIGTNMLQQIKEWKYVKLDVWHRSLKLLQHFFFGVWFLKTTLVPSHGKCLKVSWAIYWNLCHIKGGDLWNMLCRSYFVILGPLLPYLLFFFLLFFSNPIFFMFLLFFYGFCYHKSTVPTYKQHPRKNIRFEVYNALRSHNHVSCQFVNLFTLNFQQIFLLNVHPLKQAFLPPLPHPMSAIAVFHAVCHHCFNFFELKNISFCMQIWTRCQVVMYFGRFSF